MNLLDALTPRTVVIRGARLARKDLDISPVPEVKLPRKKAKKRIKGKQDVDKVLAEIRRGRKTAAELRSALGFDWHVLTAILGSLKRQGRVKATGRGGKGSPFMYEAV